MTVSGALKTTIAGQHSIRVFRTSGTGTFEAYGDVTVSYHPLGSTGTNVLSEGAGAAGGSAQNRTPSR